MILILFKYSQVWLHVTFVGPFRSLFRTCFCPKMFLSEKKILLVKKLSFWPRQIIEGTQALYEYLRGRCMNNEEPIKIIVAICLKDLIFYFILYYFR